jgi:hypothetical protein
VTATVSYLGGGGEKGHCLKSERPTPWGAWITFGLRVLGGGAKDTVGERAGRGGELPATGGVLKEGGVGGCCQADWAAKRPVAVVLLCVPCMLLSACHGEDGHPQSHPGCPQCRQ